MFDRTSAEALTLVLQVLADRSKQDSTLADALLRDAAGVVQRLMGEPLPEGAIVSACRDDGGDVALLLSIDAYEGEIDEIALRRIAAGRG
jgi:hypothetical protein